MFPKKEIKYGYSVETTEDKKARIVKPSNLTKIKLTPTNSKFVFHGTRHDILKWMSSHSDLLVEYDQSDQEQAFTPPSSPLLSTYPEGSEVLVTSPTSLTPNSTIDINKQPHDIVFDLFTIPDDSTFNRPLNIALKCIPWIEVTLEIRPANEQQDSKLFPIHRVMLPSGSSLAEISKALEKSWKSPIPDSTAFGPDCFIRNNELLYPQNKSKCSDNDCEYKEEEIEENKYDKLMAGIAKRVPTVDLWLRQKQTSGVIPSGVLTPYIIDDVLEDLNNKKDDEIVNEKISLNKRDEADGIAKRVQTVDLWHHKKQTSDIIPPGVLTPYIIDDVLKDDKKDDGIVNEKISLNKRDEAELDKELVIPDLPKYESVFDDRLLERGKSIRREKYLF